MPDEEKSPLEVAIDVVNMFNATAPGVASLILLIKRKDGVTVMPILDEADESFEEIMTRAEKWLIDHPKNSTA